MEIELPNYGINVAGPGGVRHKGYTEAQMREAGIIPIAVTPTTKPHIKLPLKNKN